MLFRSAVAEEPVASPPELSVEEPSKPEPPVIPKPVNGAAHSLPKLNGSTPQALPVEPAAAAPAPPPPAAQHAYAPASASADVKPSIKASVPSVPASSEKEALVARRNDIENPPEKPAEPEGSKKKSSFVTRTLWTFIMIGGFICESHTSPSQSASC